MDRLTNDEIRNLVCQTYFMDRSDRMVVDLLNHYAFVLHENLSDLTDDDIEKARNFADNYLKEDWKWEVYDQRFNYFVNQQRFKAITSNDYNNLEKKAYDVIYFVNNVMGVNDWNFKIYYSVDHGDCLLLSKPDIDGCYLNIDLVYNYEMDSLKANKIKITDEMEELGIIYPNCYKIKKSKTKNVVDSDIDIKI